MNRRSFLVIAATAWLALHGRAPAAAALLFHAHGHGLAFSADGRTLLAPSHAGLAAYEDGAWWQAAGPAQGFSGFSVTEHAIYSSGHAGLMRSTDGGRTWKALALEGEGDFPLIAAGHRSGVIYVLNVERNAAMAKAGIFVTRDEGKSWREAAAHGLAGEIHGVAAHPRIATMLAVATGRGLYLSRNAGEKFEALDRRGPVTAVAFDHEGQALLYARALGNEVVERALDGTRRNLLLPPLAGDYVTCLAHSPADDKTIAFATRRRDVFMTRDAGMTWTRLAREGAPISGDAHGK